MLLMCNLATKMSEYTFAYKYANSQVEITCKDALDRSGVKELFARVMCARNKGEKYEQGTVY